MIDIFVCSPYSHPDPVEREARYLQARDYVQRRTREGLTCFSPIVYFHEMAKAGNMPYTHDEWVAIDSNFQRACRCAHALVYIDGWENSIGCKAEREFARAIGQPCFEFYTPTQEYGQRS